MLGGRSALVGHVGHVLMLMLVMCDRRCVVLVLLDGSCATVICTSSGAVRISGMYWCWW
jgi:hypothetical protein